MAQWSTGDGMPGPASDNLPFADTDRIVMDGGWPVLYHEGSAFSVSTTSPGSIS